MRLKSWALRCKVWGWGWYILSKMIMCFLGASSIVQIKHVWFHLVKHSWDPNIKKKSSLLTRGKIYYSYFSSFKITSSAKYHHGKTAGTSSLDFQLGPNIGNESPRTTFLALEDANGDAGRGGQRWWHHPLQWQIVLTTQQVVWAFKSTFFSTFTTEMRCSTLSLCFRYAMVKDCAVKYAIFLPSFLLPFRYSPKVKRQYGIPLVNLQSRFISPFGTKMNVGK